MKRDVLSKIPFFLEAPHDLQRAFLAEASLVQLGAGDYFLREGDSCEQFAIVATGRMRVFKLGETGHEITLYHVGPGELCPLNVACILSNRSVPAMARIEEDAEAIVVPAARFRQWIAEHEALRTFVFQMFSTRLGEVMSLVEEVSFRRMDQRLARCLAGYFSLGDGSIGRTHAEIAADLGTAREVVSRLLKEFERLGAISLARGGITLRDSRLLDEFAAGQSR
jgi:CRP/FNR family transcriptional regulator